MSKTLHKSMDAIERTQAWVEEIVIAERFCPFAEPVSKQNQIRYSLHTTKSDSGRIKAILEECEALLSESAYETTLLIYTDCLADFYAYLDFVDIANKALIDAGYEGILQLASFHPQYEFAETHSACPSHYTNRSPYPMLHIIKESSITEALETFANPHNIAPRNIERAISLGADFFKPYLSHKN